MTRRRRGRWSCEEIDDDEILRRINVLYRDASLSLLHHADVGEVSLSGSDISGGAGVVWLPCEDSGWLGVTLSGGEPLFFWEWTRGRKRAWKH